MLNNLTITVQAAPELLGVLQALAAAFTSGSAGNAIQANSGLPQANPATLPTYTAPAAAPAPAYVAPPPAAPAAQPVPPAAPVAGGAVPVTGAPQYTIDQLSVAATPLLDDPNKQQQLTALLQQFGVAALTQLPQEHYGAFATALRGLGAQI